MLHLEHVADRTPLELVREYLEKRREVRRIKARRRGKLPEDGTKLLAELEHARREEALDRGAGFAQIAAMRRVAGAFHCEDEAIRRLGMPFAEARRLLRAVEGAVDLDR